MAYVILIISFFLDGILSNYLPFMVNDLSYFTPFLTLVAIGIIYPFFQKQEKKYFITILITGFLYDLFYTNLLFTNMIFFGIMGLLISFVYKKINLNPLTYFIFLFFQLCFYFLLYDFCLFLFNIVPLTIENVFYQISHNLLLNLIYGEILYLLCKYLPHKRSLN